MIRKFECNNCKVRFEADDAKQVQCPKCGSDNVEYAHFHIPNVIWKVLGVVLLIVALVFVVVKIDWGSSTSEEKPDNNNKDTLDIIRDTTYINETGLSLPPIINIKDLTFEESGYSFNVNVENPPSAKYYYAVLDPYDSKKIVAKSDNGKFNQVPYSNADGGVFDIALIDESVDSIICKIDKPGFIKQQAVAQKMTVAELQAKIDSRDQTLMGAGKNDYLNPEYKLKLVGLPSDAVNVPSTLGEVFDKLENEIWSSVKVNSLEYDDMNRISVITLSVHEE